MLQFVMDMGTKNKDTESFLQALVGACKNRGIQYDVITKLKDFDFELPYVILEPCDMALGWGDLNPMLDMDKDTTAKVIRDEILRYSPESGCEVLLIGRGKVVGLPTANLLLQSTNSQLTIANSWCGISSLADKMKAADIIINTSTSRIMADVDLADKLIIDVNNNLRFRCYGDRVPYRHDQKNVGRATVNKILDLYEIYMGDQSEEACTILEKNSEVMF